MKRKANWITFEELADTAGIKVQTISNYLARDEFDMFTEFKRRGLKNLFYVCPTSTTLLANLLKARQRYLPAKCIRALGEQYVYR